MCYDFDDFALGKQLRRDTVRNFYRSTVDIRRRYGGTVTKPKIKFGSGFARWNSQIASL